MRFHSSPLLFLFDVMNVVRDHEGFDRVQTLWSVVAEVNLLEYFQLGLA